MVVFVALGLRPGRLRSNPRLFLRYSCRSRGNCRFGLILTTYFAQHFINEVQIEVQRFGWPADSMSWRNKRVSVSARAKLSWPTGTLAHWLASSMAMRIRHTTIMCISSSCWKVIGERQCQQIAFMVCLKSR